MMVLKYGYLIASIVQAQIRVSGVLRWLMYILAGMLVAIDELVNFLIGWFVCRFLGWARCSAALLVG